MPKPRMVHESPDVLALEAYRLARIALRAAIVLSFAIAALALACAGVEPGDLVARALAYAGDA